MGAGPATITATWGRALAPDGDGAQDMWLLEYTEPGVAWDDATELKLATSAMDSGPLPANDPRIHHGVWRFRVSYYDADGGAPDANPVVGKVIGTASALTDYHHGPPTAAPTASPPMTPGQTPAGSSGMKLTGSRMSRGIPQTRQTTTSGQFGRKPRVERQSLC